MSKITRRRAAWVAATAVLALGLAGGIAYATIPDSNGAIHACYGSANGQLRAVDPAGSCRPSETAIDLGGPTRGYAYSNASETPVGAGTSVTVAQLNLPAGKYLAHGKTTLLNRSFDATPSHVTCDLRVSGTTTMLDRDDVALETFEGGADISNNTLQAPVVLTSPGTLLLECAAVTGPTNAVARYRQLDAVSLDGLDATVGS